MCNLNIDSQSANYLVFMKLLEAIRALTKHAIYDATSKETVLEIFPDGFHEKLRDLIAQIISHYLPTWRKDGISKQVSLPRLVKYPLPAFLFNYIISSNDTKKREWIKFYG